eukprot:CAMPEP_0176377662 /NCGR_PEP_ID=MMETSP0126-20121128/29057_1 /TAXON_ID=141414 ORGANISM="Strombidinopsis acuminatum, Strain SPMC142" /NCGR_SAMPLE_ID=MMETSP0126 /ASSEMBLY_ACC=CAM_ASM_000229 /LENGTH=79 /DNA_ID=CAMNT_0017739613 /DNA_START=692 /DNA_END=931 /DNA_ORIENTATION=-
MQLLTQTDEELLLYLDCAKKSHDKVTNYIFNGQKFSKMHMNPLESNDVGYGVTDMFFDFVEEMLIDAEVDQVDEEPETK